MAVVVSASPNEIPDLAAKGDDIASHRRRMVTENLDTKFTILTTHCGSCSCVRCG